MKMMKAAAVLLLMALVAAPASWAAGEKPTPDHVRALTLKAAELISRDGIDKAREKFLAQGEFRWGEIYVNVIDENGTWLVYPPNPKNEGKSVLNVKDAQGKFLVQEILKVAKDNGEGWVEYLWLNPASNQVEPKQSYVKRVADKNVVTYIGFYK